MIGLQLVASAAQLVQNQLSCSPVRLALRSEFPAWRRRHQCAASDSAKRSLETLARPCHPCPQHALFLRHHAPTCAVPCTSQLGEDWGCRCSEREASKWQAKSNRMIIRVHGPVSANVRDTRGHALVTAHQTDQHRGWRL